PPPPVSTAPPAISGNPQHGHALTISNACWSTPDALTSSHQWQQCDSAGANCTAIAGATAPAYQASSSDVGQQINAVVIATDQERPEEQREGATRAAVDSAAPESAAPPTTSAQPPRGEMHTE